MGEQADKPVRNPFMKRMDPRKWQPPMQQVKDALAGNMETDAPVSFFSRKQKQGE
jgi:hypothetical protein